MSPLTLITTIFTIVVIVSASKLVNRNLTADSCTVTTYDEVAGALKSCTTLTIKGITVPAGKTLDISLKDGAHLTLEGTIKFEFDNWDGPLLQISGKGVTVEGASGSQFDGEGASYWDGKGDSGVKKPKFLKLKTTGGSTLSNIKLKNCPRQCVSISTDGSTLTDWTIDVSSGSKLGKNTDGFDISASNIHIKNAVVKNQDDCVAINRGTNIVIEKLECTGSHGLSLSVGQSKSDASANVVKDVTFSDCTIKDGRNGIHIKTHTDAPGGSISDVTYKNIVMSGITNYGINVQEDYANGGSTGTPSGNIKITGLTMEGISGSVSGSNAMPVYILCGDSGCSNWKWSSVSVTGGSKKNSCNYSPSGYSC